MGPAMKMFKTGNKKGITLVYIAILIVALIGFLGLVIDIGYMYVAKGQLQRAADAAALAGAARISGAGSDPLAFDNLSAARNEAWRFACRNVVVPTDTKVFLVSTGADCNSPPAELNDDNADNGDIVVGHWNSNGFRRAIPGFTNNSTINAVKVVARRTSESPEDGIRIGDNPVQTFFGRIFSLLPGGGIGWPFMSAGAEAIAVRKPLLTPGFTVCIDTCPLTNKVLYFQPPHGTPPEEQVAWTDFTCKQAPQIGKNSEVVNLIWGRNDPKITNLCDLCITTNNGPGEAFKELDAAFHDRNFDKGNKTFDPTTGEVTSWTVAVPVVDRRCDDGYNPATCIGVACTPPGTPQNPCSNACPPSAQGKPHEKYHVQQVGKMVITGITTTPDDKRGIRISSITCIGCPTGIPLGRGVALVR